MSWAQITLSRFAISVWQQKRGSARQGKGQSCPRAERPPTPQETPPAKGAPQAGRRPLPIATQAATGRWHLAPRAAAQHQGAEIPRWGPGKLSFLTPPPPKTRAQHPPSPP